MELWLHLYKSSARQTIHMKYQALFPLKTVNNFKMSSATALNGTLRVNLESLVRIASMETSYIYIWLMIISHSFNLTVLITL